MPSQTDSPNAPHNKARRRFWIVCAIAALGMILLPLCLFVLWSHRYSRRISQKIAAISQRGEPIHARQLNYYQLLTPDEEDVTELWRKGFTTIFEPDAQQWWTRLCQQYIRDRQFKIVDHIPRGGESWPDMALAEAYLQKYQNVHDQFHEAARRGGHARWKIDYEEFDRALTHVDQARRCALLLKVEFFVHAKQRDAQACAKCLKTMLALRNALIHEPCGWTQLTANRTDREPLEALAMGLCLLPYADPDLAEIQSQLRSRQVMADFRMGQVSARAEGYSAMAQHKSVGEKSPWLPAMPYDVDFFLEASNDYLDAFEASPLDALQRTEAIDARIVARADKSKTQFSLAYSSLVLWPKAPQFQFVLETDVAIKCADAGIAIELYRRENNKLPPTLDALVPKHLPSVPTDPFSGKPMLYKPEEKGFTLYSVGKNKTDDGGKLDSKTGDEGLFFPLK